MNSRAKGVRGERELSLFLTDAGFQAKRGVQFSQGKHGLTGADVECESLDFMHIEVKRVEASAVMYQWHDQASTDAKGKLPVVFHKRNGRRWLAILSAEDLLEIIRRSDLVDKADYKKAIESI
jgi:Holliday junction resolvase